MRINFTVSNAHDELARSTTDFETLLPGSALVIVVKPGPDDQPIVTSFEPLTIDNHPDTLREIGGQVVDFVRREAS